MVDNITIRPATHDDITILLEFEQGVISAERPFDPTLKPDPIAYYDLVEMINAPHIQLVVAIEGDQIVGSGYARIETSKSFLRHDKHAYLGFMFVSPDKRGKGINNKIIAELEQWSRSKGIKEMRLEVYVENSSAIKAYEKNGFKQLLIEMRKEI